MATPGQTVQRHSLPTGLPTLRVTGTEQCLLSSFRVSSCSDYRAGGNREDSIIKGTQGDGKTV